MKDLRHQSRSSIPRHRRSGLATLEFVLVCPFLLFMGALMINFADVALVKIRGQASAHYAGTQTDSFRIAHYALDNELRNPRPGNWPRPYSLGAGASNALSTVEPSNEWTTPGYVGAPVQGQSGDQRTGILAAPADPEGNFFNIDRMMVMENTLASGNVRASDEFPMLERILPGDGRYRVNLDYAYLQGDWNYANVGLPWNQSGPRRPGGQEGWRSMDLYEIEPEDKPELAGLYSSFRIAFGQLASVPNRNALDALDADPEWGIYNPGTWPPDFHPRPTGCHLNLVEDYLTPASMGGDSRFKQYIDRVRNVPINMARRWISVYSTELSLRMDPLYTPKGPLSDAELEALIEDLTDFIDIVQNSPLMNAP